ncbi:MAG: hypothetical protein N4A49_02465 [Marinifilaceae bacterium]|jgi:hypothetical protein|nr:hypothetical protein [Marinifilaceae bacterium]
MQISKDSNNASNQTDIKVSNQGAEPINFLCEKNILTCSVSELENIIKIIGIENQDDLNYFNSLKNNANNISDSFKIDKNSIKIPLLANLNCLDCSNINFDNTDPKYIEENINPKFDSINILIQNLLKFFENYEKTYSRNYNTKKLEELQELQKLNNPINAETHDSVIPQKNNISKSYLEKLKLLKNILGLKDNAHIQNSNYIPFIGKIFIKIKEKRNEILKDLKPIKSIDGELNYSNLERVSDAYAKKLEMQDLYFNNTLEKLEKIAQKSNFEFKQNKELSKDIKSIRSKIAEKLNINIDDIKSKYLESFIIFKDELKENVQKKNQANNINTIYLKIYDFVKLFKLSSNNFDNEIQEAVDSIQYCCYNSNYINFDKDLDIESEINRLSKKELNTDYSLIQLIEKADTLLEYFEIKDSKQLSTLINYGNYIEQFRESFENVNLEPVKIRIDVFKEIFRNIPYKILMPNEEYLVTKKDFNGNTYFGKLYLESKDANYYTINKFLLYKLKVNEITLCDCSDTLGIFTNDIYIYEDLSLSLNSIIPNYRKAYIFDLIYNSKLNGFEKFILSNIYTILDKTLDANFSDELLEDINKQITEQISYLSTKKDNIFTQIEKELNSITSLNIYDKIRSIILNIYEAINKIQTEKIDPIKHKDPPEFILFPNEYFRHPGNLLNYHLISIHMFNEMKAILEFDAFLNKLGLRVHPFNPETIEKYHKMYGVDRHYNFIRKSELKSKLKDELKSDSGKKLIEFLNKNGFTDVLKTMTVNLYGKNQTYANQYDEFYSIYKKLDEENHTKFDSNQDFIIKFPENYCQDQPLLNWLIERYKRDCIKEPKTNAEKAFNIYQERIIYKIIYRFDENISFF